MYGALIAPFTEFEFMRRALAAAIALSLGGAPIGVFLMLRRMSLVGDAMAHAILPGAAIGFLLSGLNLFAMTVGGLIAGFTVAILAGVVARTTELKEDASLATFYLVSLALGVTIVSIKGTNIDLLHVLFGNILAMDDQTLLVIAFNATITLLVLAVIYRPLVIESVDPLFLRTVSRAGAPAHLAFLALVVINLVNGFHALGTLLAVGLMILPAGIARFWSRDITGMICIAVISAMVSGYAGLVLSFQTRVPSGPAIILVAALLYVGSVLFGHVRGVFRPMVANARLLIINGLGLEGWLPRLLQASGSKAPIITATKGVAPLENGSDTDPHAWQSVVNAKTYVANISDALIAADPADAQVFRANAQAYLTKLDALDREVRAAVARIPENRRKVISTHNAFGYFAAAYGIEFIAPEGVSTESEPSARDIGGIIGQIKSSKIPAVFLEKFIDPLLAG